MSLFRKKNKTAESAENTVEEKDEALFAALAAKKKRKKRKIIITVVIIVVVILLAGIFGTMYLRRQVAKNFATSDGDVTSAQVEKGSISTTISGSGTLTNDDEETVTVSYGVEIDEVLVETTDQVKKGDIIATVDMTSVLNTMSDKQDAINDLDSEILDAESDSVDSYISSGVSGRIKKVYLEKGQSIADCMVENGALALLSLDGKMAVDIETNALSSGEQVTVVTSSGKEFDGTVELVVDGVATILVTDNGTNFEDMVTVKTTDGTEVGKGELYIHSQLKITGITGTCSSVSVSENEGVYAGQLLFNLKDTSYRGNYEELVAERADLEDELLNLMEIYQNGGIAAPIDGSVTSVIWDEDTELEEDEDIEVVTISPNTTMSVTISVDESNILSMEIGQSASVTISSISDDAFDGTVTEISKVATTSSGVTRYSATVTIDKQENMLAGMSASVVVRIQGVDDALIIPVDALHQTSSTSYVYTTYDEELKEYGGLTEVVTGISNSSYVEITSGLKEGDTVYYTEQEDAFSFGNFGGGEMPSGDFSGGGDFGGMPGGGGNGGGGMPGGGGNGGGGMPGGRG